jgi:hypothetical protein
MQHPVQRLVLAYRRYWSDLPIWFNWWCFAVPQQLPSWAAR